MMEKDGGMETCAKRVQIKLFKVCIFCSVFHFCGEV